MFSNSAASDPSMKFALTILNLVHNKVARKIYHCNPNAVRLTTAVRGALSPHIKNYIELR